jgi:cytosine/uracil/thiamine/allantoin permease
MIKLEHIVLLACAVIITILSGMIYSKSKIITGTPLNVPAQTANRSITQITMASIVFSIIAVIVVCFEIYNNSRTSNSRVLNY